MREDQRVFNCLTRASALIGGLRVRGVADESAGGGGWGDGDVSWGNGVCEDGPFGEGGGIHQLTIS